MTDPVAPAASLGEGGLELPPSERTIQRLLELQAERRPDQPCLVIDDTSLTFAEAKEAAARFAGTLREAGVGRGDRVTVMSANRWEVMQCFLACAWTGAVFSPINPASRGAQLQHLLTTIGPKVIAVEAELMPHVTAADHPDEVERLWCLDDPADGEWAHLRAEPFPQPSDAVEATPVCSGDPLAIICTSGTTGPSKGVVCSHAQFYWWGFNVIRALGIERDDTIYSCMPLFHTMAVNGFVQALMSGANYVIDSKFSPSQFWERVASVGATVTYLIGAMVAMLDAQEPGDRDRAHDIRIALAPGTRPDLWEVLRTRFGIEPVEGHGMTESNVTIGARDGEQRPGWMGRVMPGFDARVVDDEDAPVPDGTPGELVLRADDPYALASGYWRNPEATVAAWRNLWFHTGDRVVRDEEGWFRFLDRAKDAIRRRGENVSAWEVEQALVQHPQIEAVAVIPVPSSLGEDEVMACIVPRAGETVDPVDVVEFCQGRIPYFAIPRYVDMIPELPLTDNGKVRKFVLRERAITPTTWDREAAGVKLGR
ncbi:MAG: ATP-dependent acyl-CoA ligase [Solirubrobacterales bacterium]